MYEYKFVKLDVDKGFWTKKPSESYQETIRQHARQGWRLVQIFAPRVSGYGVAPYIELIFEKPK